jgi:uncharacterized membrane protein
MGRMTSPRRVEAFSDGVLAIAITLLVLALHVPTHDDLRGRSLVAYLAGQWPSYAAYGVSFLVIGIIWVNHHSVFGLVVRVDRMLLFLNLVLLLFVAAIPFTTALLAEYLRDDPAAARTAAAVYSAVMLAMGLAFGAVFGWAVRRGLLDPAIDRAAASRALRRFNLGALVYTATIGVALLSPIACLAMHLAIALYYCFEQAGGANLRPEPAPGTTVES